MDYIQRVYFNEEKVNEYLVNKLNFSNWKIILHRDRLEFLTYLHQKHITRIYFQNVSLNAQDQAALIGAPTIEEVITTGFNGTGGVCIHLNYFVHLLLVSLGFDSWTSSATFVDGTPHTHVIVIVKLNTKDDELYLMDLGSGLPLNEPVPLHKLPYKVQVAGFFYEFKQCPELSTQDNIVYGRYRVGGSIFHGPFTGDKKESLQFSFTLTPRSFEFFNEPMNTILLDQSRPLFRKVPYLFHYLKNEYTEPDDNQWVTIYGDFLLVCGKNSRHTKTYRNFDELIAAVWKYFPNFNPDEMRLAFEHFKNIDYLFNTFSTEGSFDCTV